MRLSSEDRTRLREHATPARAEVSLRDFATGSRPGRPRRRLRYAIEKFPRPLPRKFMEMK